MCIRRPAALVPMALLRFLQPTTGLPDPRGALSSSVPSQAIAEVNRQVQEATSCSKKKWGPYDRFGALCRWQFPTLPGRYDAPLQLVLVHGHFTRVKKNIVRG